MSLAETCPSWSPTRGVGAVSEDSCAADPAAPPTHWIYEEASIGFVTSGWFEYASGERSVFAAPGAIILGNAQEPFSVRHVDALGNRRLVVTFSGELLEEIANDAGVAPHFDAIALPPGRAATRMFVLMRALEKRGGEDMLYPLAHAALTAKLPRYTERVSARDRGRVQNAVRYIDANFDQPCSLQSLAELTGLSRFHFVRLFGAIVGQSPNQYLINTRTRMAADRLTATKAPIAQIAFDVGFNDISHFYSCFREAFGCTPRQWRMRS
jgi:AraC family transcriptional regulator